MNYYAVAKGREIGVFTSWDKCLEVTKGYPNAKFKRFKSNEDAIEYIEAENTEEKLFKCEITLKEFEILEDIISEASDYVHGSEDDSPYYEGLYEKFSFTKYLEFANKK